jgi:hypothetical protein
MKNAPQMKPAGFAYPAAAAASSWKFPGSSSLHSHGASSRHSIITTFSSQALLDFAVRGLSRRAIIENEGLQEPWILNVGFFKN